MTPRAGHQILPGMSFFRIVAASSLVLAAVLSACTGDVERPDAEAEAPAPRTPGWLADGSTHTVAQAERGAQVFLDVCATCHALDDFRNPIFHRLWAGNSVGDFYRFVANAMPYNAPGSLEPQEYADVLAFIFRENAMPEGDEELPADPAQLRDIHLQAVSE